MLSKRDRPDSREEFVRLFVQHEAVIWAYILSLVPRWADAEDIFQETSVRIFEQMDRWDSEKDFRSWACTTAYYQVLTYRKRDHRVRARLSQTTVELLADQQQREPRGEDARRRALRQCLEKLDQNARGLLNLAYWGDVTVQQIAEQMDRNVMAIYKMLSRLRMILRDCVERTIESEGRE